MQMLIAEDNPADVRLITAALEESGIQVEHSVVHNGTEAKEHLDLLRYDLVLLDINLPQLTGLEVLESFGGEPPSPVVIFSSGAAVHDRERLRRAGALAYYEKPLDLDRYLAILAEIVNGYLSGTGRADRRLLSPSHN